MHGSVCRTSLRPYTVPSVAVAWLHQREAHEQQPAAEEQRHADDPHALPRLQARWGHSRVTAGAGARCLALRRAGWAVTSVLPAQQSPLALAAFLPKSARAVRLRLTSRMPVTSGATMPVDCAMVLSTPVKLAADAGKMSSTMQ